MASVTKGRVEPLHKGFAPFHKWDRNALLTLVGLIRLGIAQRTDGGGGGLQPRLDADPPEADRTLRMMLRPALTLALLLLPATTFGQSLSDARAFTLGLYQAYEHGSPDYLGRQARQVFSPALLRLIRRDAVATPQGDVGALDGDPICDCQDPDGLADPRVRLAGVGPGRARADVHFRIGSEPQSVTLDLVAVHGRWRVDDVHTRDMKSLAGLLQQSLSQSSLNN